MGQSRSCTNPESAPPFPIASADDVDDIDRDECLIYIRYVRFGPNQQPAGATDGPRSRGRLPEPMRGSEPEGSLDEPPGCPNGHSSKITKDGRGRRGEQRYLCHECETSFTVLTGTIFEGRQFTLPEMVFIISHMDELPATEISEAVPQSYRSVRAFLKTVESAEESLFVKAFRTNGQSREID